MADVGKDHLNDLHRQLRERRPSEVESHHQQEGKEAITDMGKPPRAARPEKVDACALRDLKAPQTDKPWAR